LGSKFSEVIVVAHPANKRAETKLAFLYIINVLYSALTENANYILDNNSECIRIAFHSR